MSAPGVVHRLDALALRRVYAEMQERGIDPMDLILGQINGQGEGLRRRTHIRLQDLIGRWLSFEVESVAIGKSDSAILSIQLNKQEIVKMQYQITTNETTGISFDHQIAVLTGEYVVLSHGKVLELMKFGVPMVALGIRPGLLKYRTIEGFEKWAEEKHHWGRYMPEWAYGFTHHVWSLGRFDGPMILRIADLKGLGYEFVPGKETQFLGNTFQVIQAEDFVGRLPFRPMQFEWQPYFTEPANRDLRLLMVAASLAVQHKYLSDRDVFVWDLMPYNVEAGKLKLEYYLPKVREEIAAKNPDVDIDEVISRYRDGERVFDYVMAKAVAQYAAIAPISVDAESVGRPMGTISHGTVSLIRCHTGKYWVNTGVKYGESCLCCGAKYVFHKHPDWTTYYVDTAGHTFVRTASLPFDDQKGYSQGTEVPFNPNRFASA